MGSLLALAPVPPQKVRLVWGRLVACGGLATRPCAGWQWRSLPRCPTKEDLQPVLAVVPDAVGYRLCCPQRANTYIRDFAVSWRRLAELPGPAGGASLSVSGCVALCGAIFEIRCHKRQGLSNVFRLQLGIHPEKVFAVGI